METTVAKAYWVTTYISVPDPDVLARYAALAGPVVAAAGGRFLVRNTPAEAHESGKLTRCVIVEFDNLAVASATHQSSGYAKALAVIKGKIERDFRIVEGV